MATPEQPPEQPGAEHQDPSGQGHDPMALHDDAVAASKLLQRLATGLAHANAPRNVTKAFESMAETCDGLAKSMSRAPAPPAPQPKAAPAPAQGDKTGESLSGAADMYGRGR